MKERNKKGQFIKGHSLNNKEKNGRFIDGRKSKKYYCLECSNIISYQNYKYGSNLCRSCSCKKRYKDSKNHPNYKNGIFSDKRNRCLDCNKELSDCYAKRCLKCAMEYLWKNKEYKNSQIKKILKGNKNNISKPEKRIEKILNKIIPNEYKFVGDGKVILNGFNPDFINCNGQKKIIELYGDYWHNKLKTKERDKRRLKEYNSLGYKTLIIWEHELKELNILKIKILEFNKL